MLRPAERVVNSEWCLCFADDEIDLDATRKACAERMRHQELLAQEFPQA